MSSNEGADDGTSAYNSEFRNLFGGDKSHAEEAEVGGLHGTGSVPPASLVTQQGPMQMFEGHAAATAATGSSSSNNNENNNNHNSNNNITPNILLEQLAYVDNFMPSLEQDFASLDSWILQDAGAETGSLAAGGSQQRVQDGGLGFDERLAAELSAFADDSFIFPDEDKGPSRSFDGGSATGAAASGTSGRDEDKRDESDSGERNEDTGRNQGQQEGSGRRNAHFLTQRRNTFLTSQYDHSKSRFSSKSRRKREFDEERDTGLSSGSAGNSPLQDHGGFTNVDIVSGGDGAAGGASDARSPRFAQPQQPPQHSSNVPSPLSNILASQMVQPYSVSASPVTTVSRPSDSVSVVSEHPVPSASTTHHSRPQIHIPDYSTLPTSTLVALLPRVSVPAGARRTLVANGFDEEHIDAIAAIIAHHEQEKFRQQEYDASTISNSRSGSSGNNNRDNSDNDGSRNADLLLDILSSQSRPKNIRQQEQQEQQEQQGFVESLLQLDARAQDSGVKREQSVTEIGSGEAEDEEDDDYEDNEIDEALSSAAKRRKLSLPPASGGANVQKSHQRRKLKEKELENSVTDLSELAVSLQQKIHTLEMENKLLKNLVRSSGELEGVEKAESIRRQLMDKINGTKEE